MVKPEDRRIILWFRVENILKPEKEYQDVLIIIIMDDGAVPSDLVHAYLIIPSEA